MSGTRRGARRILAVALLPALVALAAGCGITRISGTPPVDPTEEAEAAVPHAPETAPPGEPVEPPPPEPEPEPAAPKDPPAPEEPEPEPAEVEPEESDQVQVELSAEERADLVRQARESLAEIRRSIAALDRYSLTSEQRDRLTTVESLVENAHSSFDDDVRAAATLARKARLLLDEITAE